MGNRRTEYQKRRIYWKAVNRSRARFVRPITRVWRKALDDYLNSDEPLAIKRAMEVTYIEVGGKFARSQRDQLVRRQGKALGDIDDQLDATIAKYVDEQTGDITRAIQNTTATLHAEILADLDLSDTEKLRKIERLIVVRSRFLAEQEIVRASNYGQNLGVDLAQQIAAELGEQIMYAKTWVATIDNVVRDAHAAADGQTVRNNEYFIVDGEKLFYPKDPDGSPGNTINCRCTQIVNEIKESL